MTKRNLTPEDIRQVIDKPKVRIELGRNSIRYFFAIYFSRYIGYPMAPFHDEFFSIAEDESIPLSVILAFRGSAKSTIFSLCYPIWAITGKPQKKFVLLITQTQIQARKILDNIKTNLETNELMKSDIGPFIEESSEWSSMSIVLKRYDARIMVASVDQSVRGLLHKQNRPDVIIIDDPEDLGSVKTQEMRDKLFSWFTGDIVPLKGKSTRFFVLGTRLHHDDLLSRLIKQIDSGERSGIQRQIPIVSGDIISWPGKYPDWDAIENEKRIIGNKYAWEREYMLRLISPEDQLILPEWIQSYPEFPPFKQLRRITVGIDLAIQQKETSDYTSMICIYQFGEDEQAKYFIGTPIINKRLSLHTMCETAHQLYTMLPHDVETFFVVEDVGYQLAALEELKLKGVPVEGTQIHGQDKYTRLSIVSTLFEQGRVYFPQHGADALIAQLTGFPNEAHDDMVDALVYALLKILEEERRPRPNIYII